MAERYLAPIFLRSLPCRVRLIDIVGCIAQPGPFLIILPQFIKINKRRYPLIPVTKDNLVILADLFNVTINDILVINKDNDNDSAVA